MENRVDINGRMVSWSALSSGVILSFALTAILNLLGTGLGAGAIGYMGHLNNKAGTVGFGAAFWLIFSVSIALFAGAWLTGFLARQRKYSVGGFTHGLMVWAIATIISALSITTGLGVMISGATNMATSVLSNISMPNVSQLNLSNTVSETGFNSLRNVIKENLSNAQVSSDKIERITLALKDYLTNQDGQKREELRKKASKMIADNSNMQLEQADRLIDDWAKLYEDLKNASVSKAKYGIKQANKAVGGMIMVLLMVNVISGITAIIGGIWGYRKSYSARQ